MQHYAPFLRCPDRKGAFVMKKYQKPRRNYLRELREKAAWYGLEKIMF